jgi:hypothetical protein
MIASNSFWMPLGSVRSAMMNRAMRASSETVQGAAQTRSHPISAKSTTSDVQSSGITGLV